MTLPEAWSAGIGAVVRFLPLLALLLSGCSAMKSLTMVKPVAALKSIKLPWNSRTNEQAKLNAVTEAKPTTREEEILHISPTKAFNPGSANFGSGRSVASGTARTNDFLFENKTRTKSFSTRDFGTKSAWGTDTAFGTKESPTKESRFAGMTSPTKSYATRENWEAGKSSETRDLPGGDLKFVAKGRRQAELEKNGSGRQPMGGDRESGQSWSGDLKPMSIQDVKTLLNKN